ncbi:hypothetical protein B5F74_02220 [Collinsella sp. An271]|uniref:hypothetical protein n=1 Tax=Collinsella sp. An271 TaxID=1965616 RepID=UPI000B3B0620|nr:hypothetical protein [Collinsella sp. An271]OUO62047.1 hypothetical protein B5F74_02220 [Collinsella sp. An271]
MVGKISKSVLTAIANAIRAQNCGTETYLPSEMAAAVLALDGTGTGTPLQEAAEEGTGIISSGVFDAIADAIRVQTGGTETYTPPEMAAAILALCWQAEPKVYVLLLEGGMLEACYRAETTSELGNVLQSWEAPGEISALGDVPWRYSLSGVQHVYLDESLASSPLACTRYWFHSSDIVEIHGFENLAGVTDMRQMCDGCSELETIWSDGFIPAEGLDASAFSLCHRLVGGSGYVCGSFDDEGNLNTGEEGILTDPDADGRTWVYGHLYADGELVVTASSAPEAGRQLLASGRLCAQAAYRSASAMPWDGYEDDVLLVTIASDVAALEIVSLTWWFYGCSSLASVQGMGNLGSVTSMDYCFSGCASLETLDLTGFDPGALVDLSHTFNGCSALETILVDADWALAEGAGGMGTFYGCTSLVGGAGTVWSEDADGASMMRVDAMGTPGYLTAAP